MALTINDMPVEVLEHCFKYLNVPDLANVRSTSKNFYNVCNLLIEGEFRKAGIRQAKKKDSAKYKAYANLKLVSDVFMQSGLSNLFLAQVTPLKFAKFPRDAFCPTEAVMRKFLPSLMKSIYKCSSYNESRFQIVMTLTILRYLKEFKGAIIVQPVLEAEQLQFSFNLLGVKWFRFWWISIDPFGLRRIFSSETEFQEYTVRTSCISLLVVLYELYSASNSGDTIDRSLKTQIEVNHYAYRPLVQHPCTTINVVLNGNTEVLNFFLNWFRSEAEAFVWPENWPNGAFLSEFNIIYNNITEDHITLSSISPVQAMQIGQRFQI